MDKWIIVDWYRNKDTPDFIGVAMSDRQIDNICDELENKGVIPKGIV